MSRIAVHAPPKPPTSVVMAMTTLAAMANVTRRRGSLLRPDLSTAASAGAPCLACPDAGNVHGRSRPVPTVIRFEGTPAPAGATLHPRVSAAGLGFCPSQRYGRAVPTIETATGPVDS